MFNIPLVKEVGQLSEQTFEVQIQVSNNTYPLQPASIREDYDYQTLKITFLPNQQTVSWEFELIPNNVSEENEAFCVILSPTFGSPKFLSGSQDVFNESLIIIHDHQSLFNTLCLNY